MANQPEVVQYDAGVYQLEIIDPVDGGVGAVSNAPLLNLANRTAYLKYHMDQLEAGLLIPPTLAPLASPAFTGSPTAPTQSVGDNTTKIATDAFVQRAVNGVLSKSVAGGVNVTLAQSEYGYPILVLTGALTASISVIFPAQAGQWTVQNNTTGAYTVTCKTAAGTGVVVTQGRNSGIWCDATNIYLQQTDFISPALTGTPTAPTPSVGDATTKIATMAALFNAVDGVATVNCAGGSNVTLTQAQYGYAILNLTGALTADISVIFPTLTGQWIVQNNTTGNYAVTLKMASGTTVNAPQSKAVVAYSDATNMNQAGGTGATGAGADSVFYLNGQTVNNSYTIPTGQNAMSAGPITIANGQTVTVPNGSVWSLV